MKYCMSRTCDTLIAHWIRYSEHPPREQHPVGTTRSHLSFDFSCVWSLLDLHKSLWLISVVYMGPTSLPPLPPIHHTVIGSLVCSFATTWLLRVLALFHPVCRQIDFQATFSSTDRQTDRTEKERHGVREGERITDRVIFSWPDKTIARSRVVILQPDKCLKIQTKIYEFATLNCTMYNAYNSSTMGPPYLTPSLSSYSVFCCCAEYIRQCQTFFRKNSYYRLRYSGIIES